MMNCIIGDQSPVRINTKHWCQFLNRETAFFVGAEKLAKKTGEVVLFPSFKKIRRGYYGLRFSLITDNPVSMRTNGIVEEYAEALENVILNSPELWLWSHRRWKLSA
jgi:KDO2-lipid IV(A) lauroyltransferase